MKKKSNILLLVCVPAVLAACGNNSQSKAGTNADTTASVAAKVPDSASFETTIHNQPVKLFLLKNKAGDTVAITNYGGRLVSIIVPDKNGKPVDVILGHDSIGGYIKPKENYFGAIIGRYGNRIAKGKFAIGGKPFQLDVNDGVNTLHGGLNGFYNRVFSAKQLNGHELELTYISKDGEGGYPGTLDVKVTYSLSDDNALKIEYAATADKTTIINLTNHAYFNLNGAGSKTILDNLLKIKADSITPVDTTLIPTGKLEAVKGTPFDFTTAKTIGADIGKTDDQLKNGKGYDHNFVLNKHTIDEAIATVTSTVTGFRWMFIPMNQVFSSTAGTF